MIRQKVGSRVLLTKSNGDLDPLIEVLILEKIPRFVKIKELSGNYFGTNREKWIYTGEMGKERWIVMATLPNDDTPLG